MDDYGISDDTVTVQTAGVDSPSLDFSWMSGLNDFNPTMDPVNVDPINVDPAASQSVGSGGGGSTISSILQALGGGRGLLSDASGIMGLLAANNLKDLAGQAFAGSNPFAPYRDQYAQKLNALENNPGSVTSDPGFTSARDASLKAVERSMASQGYKGSGNMAAALYDRSNQFQLDYTQNKENQLAELAGAGISPNYGAALQGSANAYGVQSSGLASLGAGLGYALPQMGLGPSGGSAGTPLGMKGGGGFNSAGGEAAADLGLAGGVLSALGKAGSIVNTVGGGGSSSLGSMAGSVGSLGGIATGLAKGGVGGYAQAAGNAGKLYNQVSGNTGGAAGALGTVGSALNVYSGLTSGTPQGTVSGLASGAGLAASTGAASALGASAGTVAALGAAATGIGAVLAVPSVVSGVGNLVFGDLLGFNKPDKYGNEMSILRSKGGVTSTNDNTASGGGLASATSSGSTGKMKTFYNGKDLTESLADPTVIQKASDFLTAGDTAGYSAYMNSLLPTKSAPSAPQMKPQPVQGVGTVMSQLAFGMQDSFRSLQHA